MVDVKDDKWQDTLAQVATQRDGEIEEHHYNTTGRRISITDAVFGQIREDGPNYRDVCFALCNFF